MSSAAAFSMTASFLRWFSTCSASRSAKVSDRRAKNASCAARNRAHNASSTSRDARGVAFHCCMRSRMAAAVSRQSLEADSSSARVTSALLGDLRRPALGVELGEMLPAPASERVAGGGEPLPQRVVGAAVDAA